MAENSDDKKTTLVQSKNTDLWSAMKEQEKQVWIDQVSYQLEKYERRRIKKRTPTQDLQ